MPFYLFRGAAGLGPLFYLGQQSLQRSNSIKNEPTLEKLGEYCAIVVSACLDAPNFVIVGGPGTRHPLPSEHAVEKLSESGGVGYPEAGLGGSDAYLDGQQARFAEFKHALVGEVIAGTEGYFVIIVLLEHAGNGGSFIIFRCSHFHHLLAVTHFNRVVGGQRG